jgi:hypothetical protein
MKLFPILLSIAGLIILAGAMLVAFAPTQILTSTTLRINANKDVVIQKISNFSEFQDWSPWKKKDPQQVNYIKGVNGTLGSQFHWDGVAEKGQGYMELVEANENSIAVDCHILTPFESQSHFKYTVKEIGSQSEVEVAFSMPAARPFNAIAFVIGLKKEISTVNDELLINLKTVVENQAFQEAIKH